MRFLEIMLLLTWLLLLNVLIFPYACLQRLHLWKPNYI